MGGWCSIREKCPQYHATDRRWPEERLCDRSEDGKVSAWRGLSVPIFVEGSMANPQNPWTNEVHAVMLADGLRLSAAEIEGMFGAPKGMATRRVIENAVQRGWFEAEGAWGDRRYSAIGRAETAAEEDGFGHGIGKVRSVFELAGAEQ
jgi:hypothetical protein